MESEYIRRTGQLIEYIKLHIISLNQDLENLSNQMESLDPASKSYTELDIEYTWTSGQVSACEHILSVAADILGVDLKEK